MEMNIYYVNDGDNGFLHVVAPTRGKAKLEYLSYIGVDSVAFYWTDPISIRLLAKNVNLPEGVDEYFKWALANGYEFVVDDDGEEYLTKTGTGVPDGN